MKMVCVCVGIGVCVWKRQETGTQRGHRHRFMFHRKAFLDLGIEWVVSYGTMVVYILAVRTLGYTYLVRPDDGRSNLF